MAVPMLWLFNTDFVHTKHNTDLSGLNSMLRITRPKIHCIKAAASQRPRNITPWKYPAAYTDSLHVVCITSVLRHK